MFEVTFKECGKLRRFIEVLKELLSGVNFECTRSGMKVVSLEDSHVALVHAFLEARGFDFYRCDPETVTLGVKLETLNKVLKAIPNNQAVTLRKEDDDDELSVICDTEGDDAGHREAVIKLIDIASEQMVVSDDQYQVNIDLPSKTFHDLMKNFAGVGENVAININKKEALFQTRNDAGELDLTLSNGAGIFSASSDFQFSLTDPDKKELRQEYDLRFMNYFCRACNISDKATLSMTDGAPIRVGFKMSGESFVNFYLAPKIDE